MQIRWFNPQRAIGGWAVLPCFFSLLFLLSPFATWGATAVTPWALTIGAERISGQPMGSSREGGKVKGVIFTKEQSVIGLEGAQEALVEAVREGGHLIEILSPDSDLWREMRKVSRETAAIAYVIQGVNPINVAELLIAQGLLEASDRVAFIEAGVGELVKAESPTPGAESEVPASTAPERLSHE